MKLKIYAVRDQKTDMYATPMFLISNGHAIRGFADEVNRVEETNMLNKHPDDYALWALGTYDSNTGLFETHAPEQIALAADLKVTK